MQIKPRSWKQVKVDAPKGLKGGEVYEIDYNTKGIPKKKMLSQSWTLSLHRNNKNQFVLQSLTNYMMLYGSYEVSTLAQSI